MAAIKVLVVDDHSLVRKGVVETLAEESGVEVVGEASNGEEGVALAKELTPDVVLMDLHMPVMGGVDATRQIMEQLPDVQVMVLTVSDKESDLVDAMQAGARGYTLKNASSDELIRAILHIAEGGVMVSPSMAAGLLSQIASSGAQRSAETESPLSPREKEVLVLVSQGETNKEIASSLFISENTVKTHLRNIMERLHVAKRTQAVAYAIRSGIFRPGDDQKSQQDQRRR